MGIRNLRNNYCTSEENLSKLKAIQTIEKISESVTALDFQNVDLTQTAFYILMKQCSSLKKLFMEDVKFEKKLGIAEPPKISLEELVLSYPESINLEVFSEMNIQSKTIFLNCGFRISDENLPLIGNFLAQQENLESLGIRTHNKNQCNILFNILVTSMAHITSIKHLSFILDDDFHKTYQEIRYVDLAIVNKFLEMNKYSLKSLELQTSSIPAETFHILIKHMTVEKLTIRTDYLPDAFICSETNTHLKTLIIDRPLGDEYEFIFKAFPAIEYLSIEACNNISETLFKMSRYMKSVKCFRCPTIHYDDSTEVCLPSLRVLSTRIYLSQQTTQLTGNRNLLTTNPTIETLVIRPLYCVTNRLNHEILDGSTRNLTNLKRLFICEDI